MTDPAKAVAPLLVDLGFKKRAGGIFTLDLADDVIGWLGLNRATRHRLPGEVEVNPVVGVRHQGVERLVAECRGEKFHAYVPPTVSTPLGYLLPEGRYRAWVFGGDEPTDRVVEDMGGAIDEHAVPFMRSTIALSELRCRIEEGTGFEQQLAYRRPVAFLLAGERRRATKALDEAVGALGNRRDAAAAEFRRFAAALRQRIEDAG